VWEVVQHDLDATANNESTVPTRGYRKGISDPKEPVPRSVRTHITEPEFGCLVSVPESRRSIKTKRAPRSADCRTILNRIAIRLNRRSD